MEQELENLKRLWPDIEHVEHAGHDWFRIADYPFPAGWKQNGQAVETAPILFCAGPAYPTGDPYAFWAPTNLTFGDAAPNNATQVENPAFGGSWLQFSWCPDATWLPTDSMHSGSNLGQWAASFHLRLKEGQ